MRKLFLVTLLCALFSTTFSQTTCSNNPPGTVCPPIGDPYLGHCHGALDRYLARSISMDFLVESIRPLEPTDTCNSTSCAQTEPYVTCYTHCTQRYCNNIQMLTSLNAAFIRRVAGLWGNEWMIQSHEWYDPAIKQVVIDINTAYDCAGLRRPIIQAAILEYITSDIGAFQIPQPVLQNFHNDPDFIAAGYTVNGQYTFDINNVAYNIQPKSNGGFEGVPDLAKVECRMWYFFLATKYIDYGYRAIHMGDIKKVTQFDPGYVKTFDLFQKIRNYAALQQTAPFILLDAHTDHDLYLYGNSNQLILDFNSSPMRPIEVSNSNSCTPMWTVVNPQIGTPGIFNSTGGISPAPNSCYYDQTPCMLELDHHSGICGTPGVQTGQTWCPWGYDESSWFHKLSPQCRATWLSTYACSVRNSSGNKRIYMQMPGLQGLGNMTNQPQGSPWVNGKYQLLDNPTLQNTIQNSIWNVEWNYNISVEEKCNIRLPLPNSPCSIVPPKERGDKVYRFRVNQTDCNSVYTWHFEHIATGTWDDFKFGREVTFSPSPSKTGLYNVYLRQDNFGMQPAGDVKQVQFLINLEATCCELVGGFNWNTYTNIYSGNFKPSRPVDISSVNSSAEIINQKNITIEEGRLTSINEIKETPSLVIGEHDFYIYPNPVTNNINVSFGRNYDFDGDIYINNSLGQVVKHFKNIEKGSNEIKNLNVENIPSGVYFIQITDKNFKFNRKKFVKVK